MPRVSAVPYSKMDSELKAIVRASDEALNGSEWVQYFCHPTKLYKSFVKFYYKQWQPRNTASAGNYLR